MRNRNRRLYICISTVLLFILVIVIYFCKNSQDLYATLGNFYANHGNITKAAELYEKSYNMGNKDAAFRIAYVNLLINSPLSIDSQQKIAKLAEGEIKDSAAQSAKYFLYNLKKEIHNKYPENYIKQAPYNGKIMHWGKIPITYTFRNTKGIPEDIITAVNSAFDEWERASSARIRFDRVNSPKADIIVTFVTRRVKNPQFGIKYVIAYTIPTVNQDKLEKMEMELSVFDIEGKLFSPNQMYNTALHEVFHALGFMGHSDDKDSIMYMTSDKDAVINDEKKKLKDSDKSTLELLYKIQPDITNTNEIRYNYIPYLILGNNAEINFAKKTEAKNYIKKAPTIPAGYIDYAQILVNQKEYAKAVTCLERALRVADNDETKFLIYYNLAVTHFYDGSYELALVYLKKAEEIKDNFDLHLLSAEILVKQDKKDEAIKEYYYLISTNPDNINYAVNLANIYIKNKNYLKARKVLKDFLILNPTERQNPKLSPYKMLLF